MQKKAFSDFIPGKGETPSKPVQLLVGMEATNESSKNIDCQDCMAWQPQGNMDLGLWMRDYSV
jgi:hypothetical protein